jgi:integrase
MFMGGLQRVKGIWRSRRVVPVPLRPHLPPPYNASGKNGQPIGSLTKTTGTGNKAEAMRIARQENHQGLFDRILAQANENRRAAQIDAGIDWVAEAEWNDRMDLIHTDYHEQMILDTIAAYQQRQEQQTDKASGDKIDEVLAQLQAMVNGEKPAPKKVAPVPFDRIVDDWAANKNPTPEPDTIKAFRRMMRELAKSIGHDDAARVQGSDIEKYRQARLQAGKSANTIRNDLVGMTTIFNWAVFKDLIPVSPMKKVSKGGKAEAERDGAYSVEQVKTIVQESRSQPDEIRIPTLIAAYGGQRLSEILDCTTYDIIEEEGFWCVKIRKTYRPEGTRLKTAESARTVPLHRSIIADVLAYRDRIRQRYGDGPLFPMVRADEQNRRGPRGGHLIGHWIRKRVGITDKDIAPMHGFRHYVRTQLYRKGVPDKTKDSITGHASKTQSAKYEHPEIAELADAIALLPDPLAGVSRIA